MTAGRSERISTSVESHASSPISEAEAVVTQPENKLGANRPAATYNEVVHECPPGDLGLMPCCGRTPFEVPAYHRLTADRTAVSCGRGRKPCQNCGELVADSDEHWVETEHYEYWTCPSVDAVKAKIAELRGQLVAMQHALDYWTSRRAIRADGPQS